MFDRGDQLFRLFDGDGRTYTDDRLSAEAFLPGDRNIGSQNDDIRIFDDAGWKFVFDAYVALCFHADVMAPVLSRFDQFFLSDICMRDTNRACGNCGDIHIFLLNYY
jgi:hypothetical protein